MSVVVLDIGSWIHCCKNGILNTCGIMKHRIIKSSFWLRGGMIIAIYIINKYFVKFPRDTRNSNISCNINKHLAFSHAFPLYL